MRIIIGGGDLRMGYAGKAFWEKGHEVTFWGCQSHITALCEEATSIPVGAMPNTGELLLLPLPLTRDGETVLGAELTLRQIENALSQFPLVLCGSPTPSLLARAEENGTRVVDLLQDESYTLALAHITAESALALITQQTKTSFRDLHVGVLGYGRIGRKLTQLLLALGARVTVFARGEEKPKMAKLDGATEVGGIPPAPTALSSLSLLVNTVPAPVMTPALLDCLPQDALLMELATGVQFPEAAPQKLIPGHGLPGKFMPRSAGLVLADFGEKYLSSNPERNEKNKEFL